MYTVQHTHTHNYMHKPCVIFYLQLAVPLTVLNLTTTSVSRTPESTRTLRVAVPSPSLTV